MEDAQKHIRVRCQHCHEGWVVEHPGKTQVVEFICPECGNSWENEIYGEA